MVEYKARVRQVKQEALDIKSFELVPVDGLLPAFPPGSHIDVHLAPGLVRQYSLLNGPDDTSAYRIAVKLEAQSRGGSRAIHEAIHEGQVLTIGAPRNNFRLLEGARHTVLLAGGIGITPLLSMLQYLEARGESFELQYFSRSEAHTAFHDLLTHEKYAGKVGLHYALDPEATGAYLHQHLLQRSDGAHVYICGPRPFMDLAQQTAAATWPAEAVHLEYFSADPQLLAEPGEGFVVRCARSGGMFPIAADESIVDVLRRHNISIETSCEEGVCGTCLTNVLEGEPDHRDIYLTDEEKRAGDQLLPCVSRARSKVLVLDL
jgi:vanillate O-demethylase ferredoxin subunit